MPAKGLTECERYNGTDDGTAKGLTKCERYNGTADGTGSVFSAAAVSHGKVDSPRRLAKQLRDKLISVNGLVRARYALCLTGRWAALQALTKAIIGQTDQTGVC